MSLRTPSTRWFVLTALATFGLVWSARQLWADASAHANEGSPVVTTVRRASTVNERGPVIDILVEPASSPVVVGVNHDWYVTIRRSDAGAPAECRVRFDGTMPEHGHGLPTAPLVHESVVGERFRVEGVRFSMPGFWQLRAIVECGDSKQTAVFDVRL